LDLNTIGDLQPGQGYQLKLSGAETFYYPSNTVRLPATTPYTDPGVASRLVYTGGNTGNNATIIIPSGTMEGIEEGDEIGVFNHRGNLCGSALYQGAAMAISVWGNDPSSPDQNHMIVGEPYHFSVSKKRTGEQLEAWMEFENAESNYSVNGVSMLKKGSVVAPGKVIDASEIAIYPNPVTRIMHMDILLPEASDVLLTVYDITGQEVLIPVQQHLESGHTVIDIDVSSLSGGEYFYRLSTKDKNYNGGFVKMQ
jgi:hypothetical protein